MRRAWFVVVVCVGACAGSPSESLPTTSVGGSAETSSGADASTGVDGTASAGGSMSTAADTTLGPQDDTGPADSTGDPSLGSSSGDLDPTTDGGSSSAAQESSSSGALPSVCDGPIAGLCPCLATSCCAVLEACEDDAECGPYVDCVESSPDLLSCFPSGVPKAGAPIVDCFTNTCNFSC